MPRLHDERGIHRREHLQNAEPWFLDPRVVPQPSAGSPADNDRAGGVFGKSRGDTHTVTVADVQGVRGDPFGQFLRRHALGVGPDGLDHVLQVQRPVVVLLRVSRRRQQHRRQGERGECTGSHTDDYIPGTV